MSRGIETTFALLADTENEAAVDVLACALDSDQAAIRERALAAILTRGSPAGHRHVIERLHSLDENCRSIIDQRRGRMIQALRDAVLSDQQTLCANACEAIVWFHEYDLTPALITALEDEANPNAELAATTLVALAEALYAELAGPRDYRQRRDPQTVRRNVTTDLEPSVRRFSTHRKTAPLEAFLVLASRDNVVLKQILLNPMHGVFLPFVDLLTHSPRSGIIRLVLSYLDDPHAPSAALGILSHRADSRFVEHLLRKIGDDPSAVVKQNLQRIDGFVWLREDLRSLDGLEEAVQACAVSLVMFASIKRDDALRVLQRLLAHGKPRARRAAAVALAQFPGADASQTVMQLVDDDDPEVQTAAVSQLRPRGIPGALPILIELLDSPHERVANTAREALAEFSFRRYLAAFDMLDDEVRRSTGDLVKRIDHEAVPELRAELASAVRTRRLRAVRVCGAIGAARELEKPLLELLADSDHLIRAEVVRVLSDCDSPAARKAVEGLQNDASPVVREAVSATLAEWVALRRVAETDPMLATKREQRHD